MGLGNRNSAIYLSLADGKVVRRFKEPTKHTVARKITKGVNTGKEVYEEMYDYIEGWIVGIKVKLPNDPTYGKTWLVTIRDQDGTDYILQMDYSSGYSSAFLKTLPNVDLALEIRLQPTMKVENDKKKVSMFVNQKNKALKWFYTKEEPNGLPQMKKLVVKGKDVWDDTEMMAFLERMVKEEVLPQLQEHVPADNGSTGHMDQNTKNEVDNFKEEDHADERGAPPIDDKDDLPF